MNCAMLNQIWLILSHIDSAPPSFLAPFGCHVVSILIKPMTPAHIGDVVASDFFSDWKAAHFENYEKMLYTATWSTPML